MSQNAEQKQFENFNQEKGLSQGTIYSTTKYNGFIWFASQDGLNRFDGINFKVYKQSGKKGLNSNFVQALLTTSKNELLIGTTAGLNFYNPQKDNFLSLSEKIGKKHLLDSVSIEKLLEDKAGNIWVMTDENGIFCINVSTKKVETYFKNNNTFYDFCLDNLGKLWLSSYSEIYEFDFQTPAFLPFNIKERLKLPQNYLLQSIIFDSENNLWVSVFQKGVYILDAKSNYNKFQLIKKGIGNQNIVDEEVRVMLKAKSGEIWLGTKEGGMSIYNPILKQFSHHNYQPGNSKSLGENFVISMYEDEQNIVYLGLGSSGFSKYDPTKYPFKLIQRKNIGIGETLNDDMMLSFFADKDALYFGTNKGGLGVYDIFQKKMTNNVHQPDNPKSLLHNEICDISPDGEQFIWLATSTGLCRYDKKTKTFQSFNQFQNIKPYYLYAVLKTSFNEIWAGGQGGFERYDATNLKLKSNKEITNTIPLQKAVIRLFYEDDQKNIWIGTIGKSLYKYESKSQNLIHFDIKNGLNCNNIRSILKDNNLILIGTDCGLYVLENKSGKVISHFNSTNNALNFQMPNEVIYGILKGDNNDYWLSSNKGIFNFSLLKGVLKKYDVNDGLQNNEFNTNCAFKSTEGTLYFGGVKGLNYFKPADLIEKPFKPTIQFTKIKVLDSLYNPNLKVISLPNNKNFIEFEFSSSNFSNSQKTSFQYKLEGIDANWVQANIQRFANYTNLPPGEYTFKVALADQSVSKELKLNIVPAFHQKWWFWPSIGIYILLIFGIAAYLFFLYDFRNKLKMQYVRNQIASDLHDEVGSNLNSIAIFIEVLKKKVKKESPELLNILDKISTNSEETVSLMRDTVWSINPDNDSPDKLFDRMKSHGYEVLTIKNIHYTFQNNISDVKLSLTMEQRRHLYLIYKEAINNILKHAKASKVALNIWKENNKIHIKIEDNGLGFNKEAVFEGNGLKNFQNRGLNNGIKVIVNSVLKEGTTVEIMVMV